MKPIITNTRLNSGCFYELAEVCDDVLFWETDAELKINFVNLVLLELTGLEEKQLLGKKLGDILHTSELATWQQITDGRPAFKDLKFWLTTADEQMLYLNVCGNTIKNQRGIVGYSGICTIETKNSSKQIIKHLQTTNKTILRGISEALIIVDKNDRFLVVSDAFNHMWNFNKEKINQYSQQQVLEKMQLLLSDEQQEGVSLDFNQHMDALTKTKDTVKFKDGRVIERRSSPHIYEGEVVGRCWTFKDISQQMILVDKLGKLAFRDSLTKLYNRRWCEKKLKQMLKKPDAKSLAFMYLDLDHFKVINDSCGHINGDDVLAQISQLLLQTVGQEAYLSRLGGDEFGLILKQKPKRQVLEIAGNIKRAIAKYSYRWKKKLFKIGISIGVVFVDEEDDFRSVFVHADEACYMSKETGRNKCTVYNANKAEFQKTKTDLKWYDAIQKALLNGKFELWYQSIHDPQLHKPHYEILLRMRTDNDKLISPALFMGSADRFGMIFTIDKRVISDFCQFYHKNQAAVKDSLFSINISGHSLSRDGFLPFVLNCLEKYCIDCKNICFEITENEIIKNMDHALIFINKLRQLGCKIALDDFGKGLTSFSYLKNIPYDYIKIDGQFVTGFNEDKINEAIIKSIVYIAEVMNKKTIAEHIENEEMLNQIKALGVDYFQGNYFSKPLQITKLLE